MCFGDVRITLDFSAFELRAKVTLSYVTTKLFQVYIYSLNYINYNIRLLSQRSMIMLEF